MRKLKLMSISFIFYGVLYHMASEWVLNEFIFVNSFYFCSKSNYIWKGDCSGMLSDSVKRIIVWHEIDSFASQLTTHKQLANFDLETYYSSSQIESWWWLYINTIIDRCWWNLDWWFRPRNLLQLSQSTDNEWNCRWMIDDLYYMHLLLIFMYGKIQIQPRSWRVPRANISVHFP